MKNLLFILIICCSLNGFGQNEPNFDGELKIIPPYKTLKYLVITSELKNNPKLHLYKNNGDSLIYSVEVPPTDTTSIDFGQLNLKKGLYKFRITDNKGAILEQWFVVGAIINDK